MSLKFISILVCLLILIIAVLMLNKHTEKKFNYEFFSKSNLMISIFALLFLYSGIYITPKSMPFTINLMTISSLLLFGASVSAVGCLIFLNFKNTNKWYGLIGSIIQIPILIIFSVPALFFIVLGIFFKAFSGANMNSAGASNKSSNEAFFANQTKARQKRDWATNPNNMQNYNGVHQTNQRYFDSKRK